MVSFVQLREQLGLRPFVPFRVVLRNGSSIEIERVAQAAVNVQRLSVNTSGDDLLHIQLTDIDRLDATRLQPNTSN